MLFSLICAALTIATAVVVCLPFLSSSRDLPERGQFDRAVYRDQLREVDRDIARGVLNPEEAGAARLEIQRRLLAVDGQKPARMTTPGREPRMAAASMAFVILCAGGLYWRLGSPALSQTPPPGHPPMPAANGAPAADAASPHQDMKSAAERLEKKLLADPGNAQGWVLFARTESMLNEWTKAADAYQRAIGLGAKSADVYAGYGEMLVMSQDGMVSPAARSAFESALAIEPRFDVARYYVAVSDARAGDVKKAIDSWVALAGDIPDDSPMRGEIERQVAEAARAAGLPVPPLPKGKPAETAAGGPTEAQMEAAAGMPPEQRDKMIDDMIGKLAARLKDSPSDQDGWVHLGRAYAVRGRTAEAIGAFDHAIALTPADATVKLQAVEGLLEPLKPTDPLPPRAIALLNEVAVVRPSAPQVLWYLGIAASRDGRPEDARKNWTALLSALTPGGDDEKMVRAALASLKAP